MASLLETLQMVITQRMTSFRWPNPIPTGSFICHPLPPSSCSTDLTSLVRGYLTIGGTCTCSSIILSPLLRGQLWQTHKTPFPDVLQCPSTDPSPTLVTLYTEVAAWICDGLPVFLRLEGFPRLSLNVELLTKTVSSQQKQRLHSIVLLIILFSGSGATYDL